MREPLGLGDLVVLHPREPRFFHKHGIGMIVATTPTVHSKRYSQCAVRWLKSGKEMVFQEKALSRFTD